MVREWEPHAAKSLLGVAKQIQTSVRSIVLPPSETVASPEQPVLPHSLFSNTRGYIEKIVFQINRTYTQTCYDACAVMIRRLIEMLIIEVFEQQGLSSKIKNQAGDYFYLEDLISLTLAETTWSLGRNTKEGLPKLKRMGDQSAHSRRYSARREYIDMVIMDVRTVSEELLYLAGLKT